MTRTNEFGQPIGDPVEDWTGAKWPERVTLEGRYSAVVPLKATLHAELLFEAYQQDREGKLWTYMPFGPFDSFEAFQDLIKTYETTKDPHYFAILDASGQPVGIASLMRIKPASGSIEVGGIAYAPVLQRSIASSEAMFLLMRYAFEDLGYRRYEWKCDALNGPSRSAALRLGFQYEGIFRQALVYKGRNRDTAWFGITDQDWPRIKQAHENWLDPSNFDAEGRQIHSLKARLSE